MLEMKEILNSELCRTRIIVDFQLTVQYEFRERENGKDKWQNIGSCCKLQCLKLQTPLNRNTSKAKPADNCFMSAELCA